MVGYAGVKKDGKWGFINKSGEAISGFDFDEVEPFTSEGFAAVKIHNKVGIINNKGEIIVPFIYKEARYYYYGRFNNNAIISVIYDENTYSNKYINAQGKILFRGKQR